MEISKETFETLKRYYNKVATLGYVCYEEVDKILLLILIEEILTGPMTEFVTEADYNDINNALYCMFGTCLMPYPSYLKAADSITGRVIDRYRLSESGTLRLTDGLFRTL